MHATNANVTTATVAASRSDGTNPISRFIAASFKKSGLPSREPAGFHNRRRRYFPRFPPKTLAYL